jgi:hypothetical protein
MDLTLGSCGGGRTKPTVNDCESMASLMGRFPQLSAREVAAAELWFGARGQMACALEDAAGLAAHLGGVFDFVLRPALAGWVKGIRDEVKCSGERW